MIKTTPTTNVVAGKSFSPITNPENFSSWLEAAARGAYSQSAWRYRGRNIRKKHLPYPFGYVEVADKFCKVFVEQQTSPQTEPTRSQNMLVGRFVPWHEMFGYRDRSTGGIKQAYRYRLNKPIRDLVYKHFDHSKSIHGTLVPLWGEDDAWADDFYVRAGELSDWFVIDVDNHHPTVGSTDAHLQLVRHLVQVLPLIVKSLCGGAVFFDYRQDAPEGIHIWVTLPERRGTKYLHDCVRRRLKKHADASLDLLLKSHGLKAMGDLEILPTENSLIRLFGSPGRRVFTTRELSPKNGRFDAESLIAHIAAKVTDGDPTTRYGELARLAVEEAHGEDAPFSVPVESSFHPIAPEPKKKGEYFAWLVSACLNGVVEEDVLFQGYLVPLAQALYFREFHGDKDRRSLTEKALTRWLWKKHNGRVDRVRKNRWRQLQSDIRRIVRHLDETPEPIQDYWVKVRNKDSQHPDKKVSLVRCIDTSPSEPIAVTKTSMERVIELVRTTNGKGEDAKGNISNRCIDSPYLPLPPAVETRLRDHLLRACVRKGKCTERIVQFATNVLNEVGTKGVRRIGSTRMNQMATLGKGRRHQLRYKTLLVGTGILEPGWDKELKVGKATSNYRLCDWVIQELMDNPCQTAATPPHRPPRSPVKAIFKNHDRNHSENQKARTGLAGGLIDDPAFQENRKSGTVSLESSPSSPPFR